jgi:hypothetical protein
LDPIPVSNPRRGEAREIVAKMLFGDTEIKATAKDVLTQQTVKVMFIGVIHELVCNRGASWSPRLLVFNETSPTEYS